MKKKHGLNTVIHSGEVLGEDHFAQLSPAQKGYVSLSGKSPALLAHEMGHATDFKKKKMLPRVLFSKFVAPGAGMLGGAALLAGGEDTAKYAPAVVAAGQMPLLWTEGKASVIGLKAINKVLGTKAAIKAGAQLALAFGSYGSAAAGTVWAFNKAKKKMYGDKG